MALSNDLISQFVKVTTDVGTKNAETTVYGTVKSTDGETYVQLDGASDGTLTPVTSTTSVQEGDRVIVTIKDHMATIMGNVSDPSASSTTVIKTNDTLTEFGTVVANKISTEDLTAINTSLTNLYAATAGIDELTAINAKIESLQGRIANFDELSVDELEAVTADVESISADFAAISDLDVVELEVISAEIKTLEAYTAVFTFLSAEKLEAVQANVRDLSARNATIDNLDANFANIDFGNITEAAIKKIFSDTGMIKDLVVGTGTITGELVGVTISGDLIKANTLVADKLVVRGSDGNYYKLSTDFSALEGVTPVEEDSIHGSTIVAKSIVAEKIAVDDLVAFGATIGGFQITANSLYSGVKSSVDNTTRGIYLDNDGQTAIGDETNFLKFYYDEGTQEYKLEISASSLLFGSSKKNIEEVDSTAQDAQETADSARANVSDTTERVSAVEAQVQVLVDSIASLIRDGDGGTLVKQTAEGLYYFDISGLQAAIDSNTTNLADLEGVVLDANGQIDVLKSTAEALQERTEYVRSYTDDNGHPCLELGEGDSAFKVYITNTQINFADGTSVPAYINNQRLMIEKSTVKGELQIGDDQNESINGTWVWSQRSNGNMGLIWRPNSST